MFRIFGVLKTTVSINCPLLLLLISQIVKVVADSHHLLTAGVQKPEAGKPEPDGPTTRKSELDGQPNLGLADWLAGTLAPPVCLSGVMSAATG